MWSRSPCRRLRLASARHLSAACQARSALVAAAASSPATAGPCQSSCASAAEPVGRALHALLARQPPPPAPLRRRLA
eukprot:1063789-Pleurochrysis_carterae.AAC.1